jgi:hypothetical protein
MIMESLPAGEKGSGPWVLFEGGSADYRIAMIE